MFGKCLLAIAVIFTLGCDGNFPASAAKPKVASLKISNTDTARAALAIERAKENIFIKLMRVGKRCLVRDEICRFYYRGYYYQTPWWTAPEIY